MQNNSNYWDNYYKNNDVTNTPWSGNASVFFENIWSKFSLPKTGNLLDVGCGRGEKTRQLASMGLKVYGFDVSQTAIAEAINASKETVDAPTFFASDAADIGNAPEIKDVSFDVIVDLVATQFLSKEEKLKYLEGLKSHVKTGAKYLLNTFIKDCDEDKMEEYTPWVREIAQSPQMIEETYLVYFDQKELLSKVTPQGKVGTYILSAK